MKYPSTSAPRCVPFSIPFRFGFTPCSTSDYSNSLNLAKLDRRNMQDNLGIHCLHINCQLVLAPGPEQSVHAPSTRSIEDPVAPCSYFNQPPKDHL